MEREQLFKSFGFMRVGGVIDGRFDNWTDNTYEVDAWIYVDFKKKRVMIDSGDGGDPLFLKGDLTKKEEKLYDKYNLELEKNINKLTGMSVKGEDDRDGDDR